MASSRVNFTFIFTFTFTENYERMPPIFTTVRVIITQETETLKYTAKP
jgi:hypothetical protein